MKRQVIGNDNETWVKYKYGVNNDKEATVNYYFDKNTSSATKRAFLRAAKTWEKDTCINFTKNESGAKAEF
ncbi:hypothetical protein ANCCAN_29635 [Ancylostoma caninum]|uniref:Peptidase M12A domain-containing protein n=1 Tax=Ancylostoma caninum TaxID=29170 RepID=A0A368EXZ0_ANCCA|nr:hypothetical protein ANCCAN_29635 [Ancylostoma caninum]